MTDTQKNTLEIDPIPAELERALFKRFWIWLGAVGAIVIVAVPGISILLSQVATSFIDTRVSAAIEKINGLEARSLDSIARIETRALDSAIATTAKQAQASAAAETAQAAIGVLQSKLNSLPKLDEALKDTDAIVSALVVKPDFVSRVSIAGAANSQKEISKLLDWGPGAIIGGNVVNVNGGYGPITSTCPVGTYAVGVTAWGNSSGPYCIGCFVQTQILCRKLNVEPAPK